MSEFRKLHELEEPLLIANVWDVSSAKAAEKMSFKALGTSSAAIATTLGYEDGEDMSFSELINIVKRILENTNVPLSVDLESGFGDSAQSIAENIKQLADLGVVGINIEDSSLNGQRVLLRAEAFANTLSQVRNELENTNTNIFINVRTDTFLMGLPDATEESIRRIDLYKNSGADGIFIPCVVSEREIASITNHTTLPINVMCMPNLPEFSKLKALGVKRISMGNFLFDALQNRFESMLEKILRQGSFASVYD